jgi:hypothetical protein
VTVGDQNDEPTARQVHNGLVSIIGWLQLVRRRINNGRLDQQQVDLALVHIETLSRDTERRFAHIQEHLHNGAVPGTMSELDSFVVAEVGYGQSAPVLSIRFHNDRIYHYFDVPDAVYRELLAAESKGAVLQQTDTESVSVQASGP